MRKRYSEEFKREIVALYKDGQTAPDLCKKYGIARSSVFLWVKQYTKDENGRLPRELYLQQLELKRLRIENAIYRKCGCTPASDLASKLKAIDKFKSEFNVYSLCLALDVNSSTYYHHLLRSPETTQIKIMDEKLKPLIKEIFNKSCSRFGARKVRAKLREQNFTVSERRVSRLMKELDLSSKYTKPKISSTYNRQYKYYPNKLKRNFLTDAPNKVWVSDITYVKVGRDFLYLCVIIDLYSRKVIAYNISSNIDTRLVLDTLKVAIHTRKTLEDLIFHSDQGTQYTSYDLRTFLRKHKIQPSYSAPGTPYDNAVAESFFATIKKEDFRRTFYTNPVEFQYAVDKYINFYNDYRPHQSLDFMTPNQAEKNYHNKTKAKGKPNSNRL